MTSMNPIRIAEAVRDACETAALDAYEQAGIRGLCGEGRWECAVEALRAVELEAIIDSLEMDKNT
ncbi:MAG: acetyltransferase [Candidatus Hydrogenedentota bacterium]